MINYEIKKIEKGVKMRGKDQDGDDQEILVNKYDVQVEGIDRLLEIMVYSGFGNEKEKELVEEAINQSLKNLPETFKKPI